MTTLFISDLHLDESHPHLTEIFLKFLREQAVHAEALYILGDFFEVWMGDDQVTALNTAVIHALKTLTQSGVPVYLMHGNRDFLIGKQFARESGCRLINDPTLIDLYGTPTLLMHGDSLCTQDIRYQKFRSKVRSTFYQKLFLCLPLNIRKKITRKIRQRSEKKGKHTHPMISDVSMDAVTHIMLQHGAKQLIHGHTHQPTIEYFPLKADRACRIVLSDWGPYGNALFYSPNGHRELVSLIPEIKPTV